MPPRRTTGSRRSYGRGREPAEPVEADTGEEAVTKSAKSKAKRLKTNVYVGGRWYGPDYDDPPDDVAARLGDHVWETP
ncbi:MAG: hypothetical protein J2P16_00075 [Mycobacterium sp.]|nr:hypothetical protein [Mycobacterium sp.]